MGLTSSQTPRGLTESPHNTDTACLSPARGLGGQEMWVLKEILVTCLKEKLLVSPVSLSIT